jgi:hypothetical protein
MRSRPGVSPPSRQRGWIGIVMILAALVIVGMVAKEALKGYGLASGAKVTTKAATPGERARAPGAISSEAVDVDSAPQAPASALERARGVEDMLKQQAAGRAERGDGTTR